MDPATPWLEPISCFWTGIDNTDDIGSFEGQPNLVQLHGTDDEMNPYYNGQALVDRAQSVGLSATMIRLEGLGHVPIFEILTEYFEDLTTSLYQEITKGAQIPEGCHEV